MSLTLLLSTRECFDAEEDTNYRNYSYSLYTSYVVKIKVQSDPENTFKLKLLFHEMDKVYALYIIKRT